MRDETWFEETMFVYDQKDAIKKEALLKVIFNFAHDDEETVLQLLREEDSKKFEQLCKIFHVDSKTLSVDEDYIRDRLYND